MWTPFYIIWIWNNYLWNVVRKVNSQNLSRTHLTNVSVQEWQFSKKSFWEQQFAHKKSFMNDDLPEKKVYTTTNWKTLFETIHELCNRIWSTTQQKFPNKINAEFVLFTLSGCSNQREVKIFGLLPTSNYQPYSHIQSHFKTFNLY